VYRLRRKRKPFEQLTQWGTYLATRRPGEIPEVPLGVKGKSATSLGKKEVFGQGERRKKDQRRANRNGPIESCDYEQRMTQRQGSFS